MSKKEKDFSGLNMMIKGISNKNKDINQIEKIKESTELSKADKEEILKKYEFNFEVDAETMDFLKEQTVKVHVNTNNFYTELGKVFKETQEKLSQKRYGCFTEWFESLSFSKDMVYRLINRYNLIVAQCDVENKKKIEDLPLTLSYEISKESCPSEMREKVMSGEIKTKAELKKAIKEVKHEAEEIQEAEIVEKVGLDKFNLEKQVILNSLEAALEKIRNGANTPENMKKLITAQGIIDSVK